MSRAALVAFLALAAGCRAGEGDPAAERSAPAAEAADPRPPAAGDSVIVGDPPTAVPGALDEPPQTWTTRTTSIARGTGAAILTGFRAASHDAFDRVVFELDSAVPGYHVEYVDRPAIACGSGESLYLAGDAWLSVSLQPAAAHDEGGAATISPRRQSFDLPVLREAALTCDFEADVTWVLGLATPGGYRVTELSGPARLVIDLRH